MENHYKQNEKNDVKLKYKIILTRTRIFSRTINIRQNDKTILYVEFKL